MKKTLLFILCLAGMTSLSNATVTTIDCSTVTWNTSVKNEISGSAEGFDISAVKNNGQTPPTYNTSAKDVRIYAKGSITITSTSGKHCFRDQYCREKTSCFLHGRTRYCYR